MVREMAYMGLWASAGHERISIRFTITTVRTLLGEAP